MNVYNHFLILNIYVARSKVFPLYYLDLCVIFSEFRPVYRKFNSLDVSVMKLNIAHGNNKASKDYAKFEMAQISKSIISIHPVSFSL